MAITVQDLDELPQATYDQQRSLLVTLIQEYNPTVDLKRGVIHDLVLQLSAVLAAANQTNIDLVRRSCSLQEINRDPTLADEDVVDRVASNYRLTRKQGAPAQGQITVVVGENVPTVIPVGSVYTIDSLIFTTDTTFAGRTDPALVLTDTDRLLVNLGPGEWGFDVDVTAAEDGSSGNVKRAATALPQSPPPKFVKAYASHDFGGGIDTETNADLMGRLQTGMAVQAWSNRVTTEAMIRAREAFANVKALSIIGFGDPWMIRDQHDPWPGSKGGRADLYLRSQELWQTQTVRKTATLIGKTGTVGVWQVSLLRDDAPGYYEIEKVQLINSDASSAGFPLLAEDRDTDLTVDAVHEFIPDVAAVVEGTYSHYQTAILTFQDAVTDATALPVGVATQDYNVIARLMPLVAELQDFLCGRSVRPTMGDVLVKGAIPCFLSLTFTVNVKKGTTAPTVAAIQMEVARSINNLGFVNRLSASFIYQAVGALVPTGLVSITNMDILGRIRRPDGTTLNLRNAVEIVIPDEGSRMVSGNTVAILCDPAAVAVTLTTVDTTIV